MKQHNTRDVCMEQSVKYFIFIRSQRLRTESLLLTKEKHFQSRALQHVNMDAYIQSTSVMWSFTRVSIHIWCVCGWNKLCAA